ncbi:MAG: ribosome biogenesis GTP-binding protein YihA/YsxC [Clostridia bacterium]|nr:ribosome biogenesis GTP-binding protein YihA/YsxC [Clostridia bacterium]
MEIKKWAFVTSAGRVGDRIKSDLPQIAVTGKSNVGKSSFINYLTNDSKLARTSKEPGRTRLINYFLINEEFFLTDLPGYGFARVSFAEKQKWGELIDDYMNNESALLHVFFLLDLRHDPTADDLVMYNYLFQRGIPFTVIATKADKLSRSAVGVRVRCLATALKIGCDNIIPVSSTAKTGKDKVLFQIEQILQNAVSDEDEAESE